MKYFRKLYHLLRGLLAVLVAPIDFRLAKRKILLDLSVPEGEKDFVRKVSLAIHRKDGMYVPFEAQQYLSVGLSGIRCIESALKKSNGNNPVRSILDFPSGYGRVLRLLKVKFPSAEITACEIESAALEFCKKMFSTKTILSDIDFKKLTLHYKFDLIWCGSLLTHLDEKSVFNLLKLFYNHLTPGGLCVFTTHGKYTFELLQNKMNTYGLTEGAQQELISRFLEKGYGYADYKNYPGFGVSIASHERLLAIASSVGQWKESYFLERGWDNHQDVYGFTTNAIDND